MFVVQKHPSCFITNSIGLVVLQEKGKIGNAIAAKSDWLVIEADESDGSLVKYKPEIGIILNIDKDHKEINELEGIFQTFKNNTREKLIVNQSHERAKKYSLNKNFDFGVETTCLFNSTCFRKNGFNISFNIDNVYFDVPTLGKHNMENVAAAVATCFHLGVSVVESAKALRSYKGIYRRHQLIGKPGGVFIIDDYAHLEKKMKFGCRKYILLVVQ